MSERTAGFAIAVSDQRAIEDAALERFQESEREGDEFKKLAIESGYMNPSGEITRAGWDAINKDIRQIELNCLAWLRKNFRSVQDEGHDGHDDLIGTLWWNTGTNERELLELGMLERIDFVDGSYGDLYKTVFDKTSGFAIVIDGSITFFDANLDDDED